MNPDPLTTLLLLGTGRMPSPPAPPFPAVADAWESLDWSQPESAALSACALRAAAVSAGFAPRTGVSLPPACPADQRAAAPPAASALLRRILGGEFPECLSEWLECCAASHRTAAPRDLPALLDKASQDASKRPLIAAVLGERGHWLAERLELTGLFPASGTPTDDSWETGSLPQRTAWLQHHRATDPARAAVALTAAWPQESGETRAAFLTVIGNAPTPAEIPLLETATSDRKREVRLLARTALMARPQHSWSQRVFTRALPLLKLEGLLLNKRLVLHLPETFDPAWKVDGLEEKVPAGSKGLGPRAWWAVQLLACVPLSLWSGHFQLDFTKLLHLNKDADSSGIILAGWLESAITGPEPSTAEALAAHLAALEKWPASAPPALPTFLRLLQVLPDETAALLVETAEAGILATLAPGQLFTASTFRVPPSAAPRWLAALLPRLQNPTHSTFQAPTIRQLAHRFPPSFIPDALARLAREPALTSSAETFARTLEFRLQLHESFAARQPITGNK